MREKKIFLSTRIPDEKTAASKALVDVKAILERSGYRTVYFPPVKSVGQLIAFWKSLSKITTKGSHLVIEYPCRPRKNIWVLSAFSFLKGVKLYAIIHDIGDLRLDEPGRSSDLPFLKRFDGLVSHNASMTGWLRENGYKKPIVNLNVFDYCLDQPENFREPELSGKLKVLYAGNLSYKKATYIYDKKLSSLQNVELSVYGQHFEKDRINGSRISYKGVFNPNKPALVENYHFGLIWEGTSVDTCSGILGEYIRYNNPHKFSLYLSLGLPVIVWNKAAIAGYVVEKNIGFTIDSFGELEHRAAGITCEKYREYVNNIDELSQKVRQGFFLKTAIEELVKH